MEEGEVENNDPESSELLELTSAPSSSDNNDNHSKNNNQDHFHEIWDFTEEEDERIFKNFDEFLKIHEADKEQVVDLIRNTPSELSEDFWLLMAHGLPNRSEEVVKNRVLYIFDRFYDPLEGYDREEIWRLRQVGLPPLEISRRLRIPLVYVLHGPISIPQSSSPDSDAEAEMVVGAEMTVAQRRRIFSESSTFQVLKALYESAKEEAKVFNQKSFHWDVFQDKCRKASISPIPKPGMTIRKFEVSWRRAQSEIFGALEPQPSLRQKLIFIYEAYVRYVCDKKKRRRERVRLDMKLTVLFTIVYEFYSQEYPTWSVPTDLFDKFGQKVNMKKIENRLEMVKEHRKRPRVEAPKFRISARVVKPRAAPPVKKLRWSRVERVERQAEITVVESDESLEISSIHESQNETTSEDVTLRPDETILAGGGRRQAPESPDVVATFDENNKSAFESLVLPAIDEKLKKEHEKKKESEKRFELNDSVDIWSQLVGF